MQEIGFINILAFSLSYLTSIKLLVPIPTDSDGFKCKLIKSPLFKSCEVETPLVAVYGPSSPEYTPPLINKKVIIRKMEGYKKIREGNLPDGYDASLLSISPEEVMEALETL